MDPTACPCSGELLGDKSQVSWVSVSCPCPRVVSLSALPPRGTLCDSNYRAR